MFLSMNNHRNHFKDIGTFLTENVNAQSRTRNALDDPIRVKCSAHNFKEFFWSKPEVFIFKNG